MPGECKYYGRGKKHTETGDGKRRHRAQHIFPEYAEAAESQLYNKQREMYTKSGADRFSLHPINLAVSSLACNRDGCLPPANGLRCCDE